MEDFDRSDTRMSALGDLRSPEVAGGLLIVPLGATEQHGPHLPLSTDTDIAVGLAYSLARRLPAGTVVAPALAYGASGEHRGFPGTISIGQEALEVLLIELGRSATETFAGVVLLSAHGGNAQPLARATRRLREEGRRVLATSPQWRGDAHAGRVETSVMLALHAERVALDLAARGNTTPLGDLMPVLRTDGTLAVSPNGVLGDPLQASAEEGRALLAAALSELADAVAAWLSPGVDRS